MKKLTIALAAATDLIAHFFKNEPRKGGGVLISIPVRADNTDLVLTDYIKQQMAKEVTALSEAERMREALERAISFVQALADNDPDDPIADNGMTVLGKLQFDAPALIFKMRAAIGGE